jgi:hypothetical protein
MAARSRSRGRPLTDSAVRSPTHAVGVWVIRASAVGLMFLGHWLVLVYWAVPYLVDSFSR